MIETLGQVGQRPDEAERGQDRGGGDDEGQRDGGQRPEDEEQDEQRADAADQDLDGEARAPGPADVLLERVTAGQVDRHARRRRRPQRGADALDVLVAVEALLARRIDLREGRVPVLRDVGARAGGEVRARARAGVDRRAAWRSTRRCPSGRSRRPSSGRRRRAARSRRCRRSSASAGSPRRPSSRESRTTGTSGRRGAWSRTGRTGSARPRPRRSSAGGG